jgi:hypothetical protein
MRMRFDPEGKSSAWANNLWKRIKFLLQGKPDPNWNPDRVRKIYSDPETRRSRIQRSKRFIELLKTADGIFLQRFLAYPEEDWSWSSYDSFILMNIHYLIGDEFIDGNITQWAMDLPTFYGLLKSLRKSFKLNALSNKLKEFIACIEKFGADNKQGKSKAEAFGFLAPWIHV